ncbi:MAG: phosphatidylserine/phosphatidylglycerophosphate/cardiolipin synthase family protein [Synechococcus sp.]|nr:phosphatidylserine/phosphatidylglycerophosphate/cardiolipin synthase family protein [Synechococcus sp.]
MALLLGGCSATAQLLGRPAPPLPLPPGIEVAFNHRADGHYRSPIDGKQRAGDNLEELLLRTIGSARRDIAVAVQELSLPAVARALIEKQQQGVRVRVVLENTYSTPWSEQHPVDLPPHLRHRQAQLQALGWGDAVALLRAARVPLIDDTADGSAGSGLMHHKFLVVDGRVVVSGSTNFTPSCIHGDPDNPRTRGNVNHLLRFESAELAQVFLGEFERLWGDGPGGAPDSRFGIGKGGGGVQRVLVQGTPVQVLFAPHRRSDPANGLHWLAQLLGQAQQRIDLALFVFSAQNLADALAERQAHQVKIRMLADPGFAHRSFSEVLDLLGVELPDRRCRIEAGNQRWGQALAGVGVPQLAGGDKLHHKFGVIDGRRVITGSFNWSPSAAHQNDETLLVIDSPQLAAHFTREMERLWKGADLGVTPSLQRRIERLRRSCGQGLASTIQAESAESEP